MSVSIDINDQDVFTALVTFLATIVPTNTPIVQGQDNRVPMPDGPFVLMTSQGMTRLATNEDSFDDLSKSVLTRYRYEVQLDFMGSDSQAWASAANSLFRDEYAVDLFPANIVPLYADDPMQIPLINAESQYENRWKMSVHMEYVPTLTITQQSALAVTIQIKEVGVEFGPVAEDSATHATGISGEILSFATSTTMLRYSPDYKIVLLGDELDTSTGAPVDSSRFDRVPLNITAGVVQDTTNKEYGRGSVKLTSVVDICDYGPSVDFSIDVQKYTMMGWLYIPSQTFANGYAYFFNRWVWNSDSKAFGGGGFGFRLDSNGDLICFPLIGSGATLDLGTFPGFDQWFHVAVTRDDTNTIRGFVDGDLKDSLVSAVLENTDPLQLQKGFCLNGNFPGTLNTSNNQSRFSVDEVTFIKDVCLYTSDFTPTSIRL